MKRAQIILVALLLITGNPLWSQTTHHIEDSATVQQFTAEVREMVDRLNLHDTTETCFFEIYHAYGQTMKNAYENRTSWIGLNHTYQWAKRERDSQLLEILSVEQLRYFQKRQAEIERNARNRKAN